jgi:hypothetical protein
VTLLTLIFYLYQIAVLFRFGNEWLSCRRSDMLVFVKLSMLDKHLFPSSRYFTVKGTVTQHISEWLNFTIPFSWWMFPIVMSPIETTLVIIHIWNWVHRFWCSLITWRFSVRVYFEHICMLILGGKFCVCCHFSNCPVFTPSSDVYGLSRDQYVCRILCVRAV